MTYLTHITHLTMLTGHSYASPRAAVGDDVIAMLRPICDAGFGEMGGLIFEIERHDLAWQITIGAVSDQPAVRCILTAVASPTAWREALELCRRAGAEPAIIEEPAAPWLAVILLPAGTLALTPDQTLMLGDAERCVAWTLLESDDRH